MRDQVFHKAALHQTTDIKLKWEQKWRSFSSVSVMVKALDLYYWLQADSHIITANQPMRLLENLICSMTMELTKLIA